MRADRRTLLAGLPLAMVPATPTGAAPASSNSGEEAAILTVIRQMEAAWNRGDFAHALVVPFTRIGRSAADDELGLALQRLALHGVVVDAARGLVELVAHGLEVLARHVDRRTVREVASVREVESHEGVARMHHGKEYC